MAGKVYNGDEVTLTLGGVALSGFADGEAVLIEETSPRIASVAGTDGEVAVSRNADRRASITIKLLQTSDSNDVLSSLAELARSGPGLPGIGSLYIRDRNGRSLHEAQVAWIEEIPSVSYDRSATSREWKLGTPELRNFIGGNTRL